MSWGPFSFKENGPKSFKDFATGARNAPSHATVLHRLEGSCAASYETPVGFVQLSPHALLTCGGTDPKTDAIPREYRCATAKGFCG
jgi:hypothetical protein